MKLAASFLFSLGFWAIATTVVAVFYALGSHSPVGACFLAVAPWTGLLTGGVHFLELSDELKLRALERGDK